MMIVIALVCRSAIGFAVQYGRTQALPPALVLNVSGANGARVRVTLTVDGRATTSDGVVPCRFPIAAQRLEFRVVSLAKTTTPMRVEVLANGRSCGVASDREGVAGTLEFRGRQMIHSSLHGE